MRRVPASLLFAVMLLVAGCASKPEQETAAAEKAFEAATSAEADVYCAEAYQAASDALKSAKAEITAQDQKSSFNRNYDKVKELLNQAKSQADTAVSTAGANKEKVKAQALVAQTEAQAAIEAAKAALAKAPKGKATQAGLGALRGELTAAEDSLGEAKRSFDSGEFMDALNQSKAVKEKANAVAGDTQLKDRKDATAVRRWGP